MSNYDYDTRAAEELYAPAWKNDGSIEVEFTFRNGTKKTVRIDTDGKTASEMTEIRTQLLGKIRLVQTMFEHGTHGHVTVQGVTVRADDLSAVQLR